MEHRVRQTANHETILQETMAAWRKSSGGEEPGNPAYLSRAMDAMKAIREIWGVDTIRVMEAPEDDGERVAGMARDVAIRKLIEKKIAVLQGILASASTPEVLVVNGSANTAG